MKRLILFSFILLPAILLSHPAEEVKMMANRDYYPILHELIMEADYEILIIMYQARTYPDHPEGVNEQMYNDLFEAVNRGVYVQVILDASSWNMGSTYKNLQLAEFLRSGGIDVLWDPPDVTSHNKMVLIDDDVVIIGSTNWSYYALARNNEISVMIRSTELYTEVRDYYNSIKEHCTYELILDKEESDD